MAEATTYTFAFKEVVEALIKQQGIHEGIWSLQVRFGLGAINVREEDDSPDAFPAAIVPVKEIGLVRVEKVENLSVDAAVVNPQKRETSKKTSKKSG